MVVDLYPTVTVLTLMIRCVTYYINIYLERIVRKRTRKQPSIIASRPFQI